MNGDAWDHPSVTSPSSRTQPASQNTHQKTPRWWLRKYFQWNTEQSRALLKENKPSLLISSLSDWPFLNIVLFPHVHPIGHARDKGHNTPGASRNDMKVDVYSWMIYFASKPFGLAAVQMCSRGFATEDLLRQRGNNHRLPAITVREASSISSSFAPSYENSNLFQTSVGQCEELLRDVVPNVRKRRTNNRKPFDQNSDWKLVWGKLWTHYNVRPLS